MRLDFQAFVADTSGSTAIEYALIAALIACMLITSVQALGWGIYDRFDVMKVAVAGS